MNWGLIGWFLGIVLTIYGLRFVLDLCKSLFGKDARKRMIDGMADKVQETSESMSEKIKEKATQRKRQKNNNEPMITIK